MTEEEIRRRRYSETWRGTYTYRTPELIDFLREMRLGTFNTNHPSGTLMRGEVLLQAEENTLIRLPEGVARPEVCFVPFENIAILNDAINRNE